MFFNLVVTSTCKELLNWTTDVTSDISPKRRSSMEYTSDEYYQKADIISLRTTEFTVASNTHLFPSFLSLAIILTVNMHNGIHVMAT